MEAVGFVPGAWARSARRRAAAARAAWSRRDGVRATAANAVGVGCARGSRAVLGRSNAAEDPLARSRGPAALAATAVAVEGVAGRMSTGSAVMKTVRPLKQRRSPKHHAGKARSDSTSDAFSAERGKVPSDSDSVATVATADEASVSAAVSAEVVDDKQQRSRKSTERRNPSRGPAAKSMRSYVGGLETGELLKRGQELALAASVAELIRAERARSKATARLGRPAVIGEWAAEADMSVDELVRVIQLGTKAKNELVASNLRLVHSVVHMYSSRIKHTLTVQDLAQEGALGLLRATEKFDATRGLKFSTYATWWIRAAVLRAMESQSRSIRLPAQVIEQYRLVRKTYRQLVAQGNFGNGTEPPEELIAAASGMSVEKLRFVLESANRTPISLNSAVKNATGVSGDDVSLLELLQSDEDIEHGMVDEMLKDDLDRVLMKYLSPQERGVLRLRFGLEDGYPRTLEEVGTSLQLSKERIRQIVFSAMRKLRNSGARAELDEYIHMS